MAQTPTIHAPKHRYGRSGAVTACGRAAGETTTDPATITCQAIACGEERVKHERKVGLAATTEAAFHANLRAEEHFGQPNTEAITENAQRRAVGAALYASMPGGVEIQSDALGYHAIVTTADEAERLYWMANNLKDAAQKARAIIEARAYMAEYEAHAADGAL